MPDANFYIYQKDLAKDIRKNKLNLDASGKEVFKVDQVMAFDPHLPLIGLKNPGAITRDRLALKQIHAKTDRLYQEMLRKMAGHMKTYTSSAKGKPGALDEMSKLVHAEILRYGSQIQQEAYPILSKYVAERNDGKVAKKKYNYNNFKKFGGVAGAVGGVGAAITATALSAGGAVPALVAAIALTAKAGAELGRSIRKNSKDLEDLEQSVITLIKKLDNKLAESYALGGRAKAKQDASTTAFLEKISRDLFATNIPSVKKLQQDLTFLKQRANMQILSASKKGAIAGDLHKQLRELKAQKSSAKAVLDRINADGDLKTNRAAHKVMVEGLQQSLGAYDRTIAEMTALRDATLKLAEDTRATARRLLDDRIPVWEQHADYLKEYVANWISKVTIGTKFVPLAVGLAVQDWSTIGSSVATAAQKTDAVVGLATQLASDVRGYGNDVRKMAR